jgi:AcrR family transcriptional regulator
MVAAVQPVKPRRSYDGSRRKEAAQQAHARLLDAALARFIDQGYAATTLESVADDVGASVATIHKQLGGKPGLVRSLCARALAGEGPVPAERRSDALQAAEKDPRLVIEGWGRLLAEVSPRVAPILLLVRDAASADPHAADLAGELDASRLARMNHNARSLVATGRLRAGLRQRDVRDVLWMYSAPELFELLVRRRGWSVAKYSQFATKAMLAALL